MKEKNDDSETTMKWPKLRELKEAIKALIVGPYTSSFPKEPFHPHPNFRGQPKFNQDKCVGCLACEEVCPVGAIAKLTSGLTRFIKLSFIFFVNLFSGR